MRLLSALQSIRLCAADWPAISESRSVRRISLKARVMRSVLFVAQGLHGIKFGGASRGIKTRYQAYHKSKNNREGHQPPGHRPEMFRWKALALQVNVGSEVDHLSDRPAQQDADYATENSHGD